MSDYIVRLTLVIGEYEKSSLTIINDAPNATEAGKMALVRECHGNNDNIWFHDDGLIYDMGGEMAYRVRAVDLIEGDDWDILAKHIFDMTYDADMIAEIQGETA